MDLSAAARIRAGVRQRRFGTRLSSGESLSLQRRLPAAAARQQDGGGHAGMSSPGRRYAAHLGDDVIPFGPDVDLAREWEARFKAARGAALENRRFVERVVRFAAGEGYRQFADLGAGPPIQPSVHAIAAGIRPDARTVSVDCDMTVTVQSLAMGDRGPHTAAINGDVTEPGAIFASPEFRAVIDLSEPVCVLLAAVLHFMAPDEAMEALYGTQGGGDGKPGILSLIPPGSLVAVSVATVRGEVVDACRQVTGTQAYAHTPTHMAAYLAGLDLVDPGMAWARNWRPDEPVRDTSPPIMLAGAGRTRERNSPPQIP